MKFVNLNGAVLKAEEACLPLDNRGFRLGYGLFETMLYQGGSIVLCHRHWKRLYTGMKTLQFAVPKLMNESWLQSEVNYLVKKNEQEKLCRVRLQVFAGSGSIYEGSQKPEYVIECFPIEERVLELNDNGLICGMAEGLLKSVDSISNIKSSSALIYSLAAQQAKTNKWNDALICNASGNICESTIANIFVIKDKQVYTPGLDEGCVAGVMRRHLIDTLRSQGITVHEQALPNSMLLTADEVFLTNAIRRIKWVGSIGQSVYDCKMTRMIATNIFTE